MSAYAAFAQRYNNTHQSQISPSRNDQVENNNGGFVFEVSPLEQFRRFLILGTTSGTYYVHRDVLTKQNVDSIKELFNSDSYETALNELVDVSLRGLAPKLSPSIFALALAFASSRKDTRVLAAKIFPQIIRTQSHLFEFISYARSFRGMGRLLRESIQKWYQNQPTEKLAYQMIKYRNRNGYTTRDVLRLVKPKPENELRSNLYAFGAEKHRDTNIPLLEAFKTIQSLDKPNINLIQEYNLPREAIPTQWLNNPYVWEALLPSMPLTAMIRSLGKMTDVGLIKPLSVASKTIVEKLSDQNYLFKSRIHPFNLLLAHAVYKAGHGVKGSLHWVPDQSIVTALEQAFYNTFGNVSAAKKNTMIALDVSGSMSQTLMGSHLSAATASAAMALITVKTEPYCVVRGFSGQLVDLGIGATDTLETIKKKTRMPFGPTDCAAPIVWATNNKMYIDTFIVYTDNETWYGSIHPYQALLKYRQTMGVNAKLIVVGMVAAKYSIADPLDQGMLDVVGFDASAPEVISSFSRGF